MKLPGIVTNITAFGAFVDIGVHQDGLVHVSNLADHFVKDPNDVVKVHEKVWVTVIQVDLERQRISLAMKAGKERPKRTDEKNRGAPLKGQPKKKGAKLLKKPGKTGFNNPFADVLKRH